MELLINEIIRIGGDRKNFTAKIFGGAAVTRTTIDIGQKNIAFIKEYLSLENIPIISQDVGGIYPRKVYFIPSLNEVFVKTIENIHNHTIEDRERTYRKTLASLEENQVFYLQDFLIPVILQPDITIPGARNAIIGRQLILTG